MPNLYFSFNKLLDRLLETVSKFIRNDYMAFR